MPPTLSAAESASLLESARETLGATVRAFSELGQRLGDATDTPNTAMSDYGKAAARCVGPSGPWPDHFGHDITVRSALYLTGAQRYLASMWVLTEHYPNGLGLAALARSVGEACGKAIWLLDNTIGTVDFARERTARLLLDVADDARRRTSISNDLNHPDRARAGDEYRRAWDTVSKAGHFSAHEITTNESGNVSIRNQRFPGTSQFVLIAEKVLGGEAGAARPVYAYLSAATHPTIFAYQEAIAEDDAVFYAKLANYASIALHNGMRVLVGWTQQNPEHFPEQKPVLTASKALVELIDQHQL